tara:strand:+ start:1719 stop:1973 length:255 start_codon:yes stop_codon:yes gene_type:complete
MGKDMKQTPEEIIEKMKQISEEFRKTEEIFLNNPDIPQELKDGLLNIRENFDEKKLEQDKYLEENKHRKIKGYNPETFEPIYEN